ncbi:MAG: site-specific integrase [Muribaculum sp.]|nr:site-specific integrase [Muribaculum sp.]
MTSIKLIFRESSAADGEGALYLRIIHKRVIRQIHTGCRIASSEWDDSSSEIRLTKDPSRNTYLGAVRNKIKDNIQRLTAVIGNLNRTGSDYTVEEVVEMYKSADTVVGFVSFARMLIRDTRLLGRHTTAEHYASALNSLLRYHGEQEIPFGNFDHKLIAGYEGYLKSLNLCPNTTSYYMRNLRSIYNNAVEQQLTECRDPFKRIFTGVEKTVKRSVPVGIIKTLRRLDLSHRKMLDLARDLFLFSVYTRGMAFVDLAYLKRGNVKNGYLKYRRHKTARLLNIRLEKPMLDIIDKYGSDESEYIFPLIAMRSGDVRRQYLNSYKSMSRWLRKLGVMIGLSETLTFHRARHTWASTAKRNKVPLYIIKEGMGHDSERTTQIYLDSLDSDDIDNANSAIIDLLNK